MNRLILLDAGPLGMVTNPKATGITLDCQLWLKSLLRRGERIAIPEISDYEVRRELLRAGLLPSLLRLDNLKQTLDYIPIQTETMLLAAELWALVRKTGQPTADPKALDCDQSKQSWFILLKKRWVVERTFGWLMGCRRLVRDYELLPETSETFIYLAMIRIMVRRLA